jgi:hypothetical protein
MQSKINSKNLQKTVQKHFSNEMKIISSLKTRIYPQRFPNASAVTWSLVLQTRNLVNKIVMILVVRLGQLTDKNNKYT